MIRIGLEKSVRMFRKFSEETMRRRGGGPLGVDGVAALTALEEVLTGQRRLDGSLLEPLTAFTNLLQSGQLPPEFGHFNLADALLALEEAEAEAAQAAEQKWEFEPNASEHTLSRLAVADEQAALAAEALTHAAAWAPHAAESRRFVLRAAERAAQGSAVVVGALAAQDLPLAELAARFQRLVLSDLDERALEALVRARVPEPLRARVRVERYDLTGSYEQFVREVDRVVAASASATEAEASLVELAEGYDVGAGSAGLCSEAEPVDFALSSLVLARLGQGYTAYVARSLSERGFEAAGARREALGLALGLMSCLVQQHHVQALLRRARLSVLISEVSELSLQARSDGSSQAEGEPRELLSVERLRERLPTQAEVMAEASWEWTRQPPGADRSGSVTSVEAVALRLRSDRKRTNS